MIYLKKENIKEIEIHLKDSFKSKIRENKLFALLKLTEKKGTPIDAPENEYLQSYINFIKNKREFSLLLLFHVLFLQLLW